MSYHWQSKDVKKTGTDDMVMLSSRSKSSIVDNLKKRYMNDQIYTYIGPVLVSVNPFKNLPIYGTNELEIYRDTTLYENPPHIFAIGDVMYSNMRSEQTNQCVIISGESGAGKTVAAIKIMECISNRSGHDEESHRINNLILSSNPLLESFGNAKTLRNNNSSRFGKYIEIKYHCDGRPSGAKIRTFLLESGRVISQNVGERNFHIFYQILQIKDQNLYNDCGMTTPNSFLYLSQSECYTVDGINDSKDVEDTLNALKLLNMDEYEVNHVVQILMGILYIGNLQYDENDSSAAFIYDTKVSEMVAYLLELDMTLLNEKLTSREMDSKWGGQSEAIRVVYNYTQAHHAKDALSKTIYFRLFEYLVSKINTILASDNYDTLVSIGILDIYGFEIFENNGFNQLCINYVNEKLQQVFINLTLKAEQEEYVTEGISWKNIDFFNNKIVCELIEGLQNKPGVFDLLNDVCKAQHAVTESGDAVFQGKLNSAFSSHHHFVPSGCGFTIHHYAGDVTYNIEGFTAMNRNAIFNDLIILAKSSQNRLLRNLFMDDTSSKQRPSNVGTKMKKQTANLMSAIQECVPSYIRCLKPNETKKAHDWDNARCSHQVEYLGLEENIKVRQAGHAYRRIYEDFVHRYKVILNLKTGQSAGIPKDATRKILEKIKLGNDYQFGHTKIFIKDAESVFLLESTRERYFSEASNKIQEFFRINMGMFMTHKAPNIYGNRKQRCRFSINLRKRQDYMEVSSYPDIVGKIGKIKKLQFAETISKYDRRFKMSKRHLILTQTKLFIFGQEKIKKGPDKGKKMYVIKYESPIEEVSSIKISTKQDDMIIVGFKNNIEFFLECKHKTEFIASLNSCYKNVNNRDLYINPCDRLVYTTKSNSKRNVIFDDAGPKEEKNIKNKGATSHISIARGLPENTCVGYEVNFSDRYNYTNFSSSQNHNQNHNQNQNQTRIQPTYNKAPPTPMKSNQKQCRVLYDYDGVEAGELTIRQNETINIIDEDPSGWWNGECNGYVGLFPSTYVELI